MGAALIDCVPPCPLLGTRLVSSLVLEEVTDVRLKASLIALLKAFVVNETQILDLLSEDLKKKLEILMQVLDLP